MRRKFTATSVKQVIDALRVQGLRPEIVGSVASIGQSLNDVDILISGGGETEVVADDVMYSLGFENVTPKDPSKGDYWLNSSGLKVDIFHRK